MKLNCQYTHQPKNVNPHHFYFERMDRKTLIDVRAWLKDNIVSGKRRWLTWSPRIIMENDSHGHLEVNIKNDDDAMAFRLRWC